MKLWLPVVVALRLWLLLGASVCVSVQVVSAAEKEFPQYRWSVPCPSDSSLIGYVSLADLNTEMRRHSSELSPPLNRIPSQEFRYHLCPQSIFNASVPLFLPPTLLQYSPVIQCGQRGSSLDTCIFQGGENHVLLLDPLDDADADDPSTGSNERQSIVFQGIAFRGSSDISIAAFSTRTNAQFIDCHWKNIQGRAAIMMANAKAVTWPQVSQPTFVLESHNIFSSRRRQLTDTATTTTTTTTPTTSTPLTTTTNNKITMEVSFLECSFQDSGDKDDFVLLDSFMKDAFFILLDSTIQSISGSMVINMVHGSLQLVDTSISQCSTSIATVRGQYQSTMDIYNSTFSQNQPGMATIAIVKKSNLQMNATQLYETNMATVAPLVVVESSHVVVADSCWFFPDSNSTTTAAVVVDATSSLQLDQTSLSFLSSLVENNNSTTTGDDDCSARIWNLEDTMSCFNTNTCQGTCDDIPIQDQCTIPTNIPTWEQIVAPSSTSGGRTLLPIVSSSLSILLWSTAVILVSSHFS